MPHNAWPQHVLAAEKAVAGVCPEVQQALVLHFAVLALLVWIYSEWAR